MAIHLPDLGDLLFLIATFFAGAIIVSACLEHRRRGRREQRLLDAIEKEYRLYFRAVR